MGSSFLADTLVARKRLPPREAGVLSRRRRSAHLFCCFVPPVFVQARKRDRQDRLPSPVSLSGGLGIRQELYNPRKAPPMPRARMEFACNRGFLQPFRSHLSLAFASATVCHCMSEGSSPPPQANGLMRSCNLSTSVPGSRLPLPSGFSCYGPFPRCSS